MKFIIIALLIIFLKFIYNYCHFYELSKLQKKYDNYLNNKITTSEILRDKNKVKNLILKANVKDMEIRSMEPIGFGYVNNVKFSVLDNLATKNSEIVPRVLSMFEIALGEYKNRAFESFNPIFWMDFIIFLPNKIFNYLGIKAENFISKMIQIIYWISCFLYGIFSEEINSFIQNFLSSLFK